MWEMKYYISENGTNNLNINQRKVKLNYASNLKPQP